MAKFILIQEDDYEKQYQESMIYLNSKYHDQPTKLKDIPQSFGEWLAMQNGNLSSSNNHKNNHKNIPIGKLVI